MAGPKGLKKTIAEAMNAIEAKDGARALKCASAALNICPADPQANFVMGLAHEGLAKPALAERYYQACLSADDRHVQALIRLGLLSVNARRAAAAIALLERAVSIAQGNASARHYLARAYGLAMRFQDAVAAFALAHRQMPRDPEILAGFARAMALTGRSQEALALYRRAETLNPLDDAVQQGIATALLRMGHVDRAEPHLRKAIRLRRDRGTPYLQLAQASRLGPDDIKAAQGFAASSSLTPHERATFMLALGTQYEHEGKADGAYAAISQANSIRRATRSYDRQGVTSLADRIVSVIAESLPAVPPRTTIPAPLMIMGMPRSGTTLIEQMLSRHPLVVACGERTAFPEFCDQLMRDGMTYPAGIATLRAEQCAVLRARYVAGFPAGSQPAICMTDKLPDNVFSLPLIRRLFPEARILVCRRHPLDIAWSIFKQGFGPQLAYAADLEDIAHHMRQQDRIVSRWLAADPVQAKEVLYEELVQRFPETALDIVTFAGLAWNETCLSFEDSDRTILTASATQVRRGVYATSVGRWRAVARHLAPLREQLADLIAAHDEKLASRNLSPTGIDR